MSIKVSIIEDNLDYLNSLSALVGGTDGFSCVGAHATAESALQNFTKEKPHIILLDLELPKMSGLEFIRELNRRNVPGLNIVVLTICNSPKDIFDVLAAGASGYLVKPAQPARLLEALADAHAGGAPMSSSIARLVIKHFQEQARDQRDLQELSARELEILKLVAQGFRNSEIADELKVSVRTVTTHLRNTYEKLHVHSRTAAVAKFARR